MKFNSICLIAAFLYALIFFCQSAGAHSGGLDASGGHYNRKTGEYHSHRGSNSVSKTKDSESGKMKSEGKSKTSKSESPKKKNR
jgi:hypothetical protein